MMNDENALFYVCSLIEFIGRLRRLRRGEVVAALGEATVRRIYRYADTFHCEPIAKVADDFVNMRNIPEGAFDNVAHCRYEVPGYWDIGAVHARLIEDVADARPWIDMLFVVYGSWMEDALSRFNSDLYYQPRDYLAVCWREGKIVE